MKTYSIVLVNKLNIVCHKYSLCNNQLEITFRISLRLFKAILKLQITKICWFSLKEFASFAVPLENSSLLLTAMTDVNSKKSS